jgi:hypothetical protein
MAESPEQMTARINEFITDARKIVANGEEPLRHLAAGDEQSACNVISISHYAMGDVSRDYDGIVEAVQRSRRRARRCAR